MKTTHTISIEFEGLSLFAPRLNAAGKELGYWVAALPDAGQTILPIPNTGLTRPIAPHVACVVVPTAAVDPKGSSKGSSLDYQNRSTGNQLRSLFALRTQRLSVEGAGDTKFAAEKTAVDYSQSDDKSTSDKPIHKNLAWVTPFEEMNVTRKPSDIFGARPLLTDDDFPVERDELPGHMLLDGVPGLAGCVQIDQGTLTTNGIVRKTSGRPLLYDYQPPPHDKTSIHEQAQVRRVVWRLKVEEGATPELVFQRDGEAQGQIVKLKPINADLQIEIHNVELERIVNLGSVSSAGEQTDHDFALLYTLLKGWPFRARKLPVPRSIKRGVGGGGELCKPGLAQGF